MAMQPRPITPQPPQEPQPSIGEVVGGAQTQQNSGGFMENVEGLLAAFERPDVQAGLLQAGARLLQPLPVGQTLAGQIGVAASEGFEAADRTRALAREDQARQASQEAEARKTAVQERRASTEERAEERLRTQGERRLDLTEEELEQTRRLKERQLSLQAEIARAKDDIARSRIIADLSQTQSQIDSLERRAREQVAAQLQIADKNQQARIATAATSALLFYPAGTPLSTAIRDVWAGLSAAAANPDTVSQMFPEDPAKISDTSYAEIVRDPFRIAMLLSMYYDPAAQSIIRQKLYEARQKAAAPKEK